jgi:hypothetical protein
MSPTKAQLGRKKKRKVNGTALLHFSFNKLTKIDLISHRFFILIPKLFYLLLFFGVSSDHGSQGLKQQH